MTVTLNLPPNIEQIYLAEAQSRGLAVEEVITQALVAARPHVSTGEQISPDEWMRRFKTWAHSHDSENLPVLSDQAVSRDSMYD